jgi:probable F420-dependent oxidoreductase
MKIGLSAMFGNSPYRDMSFVRAFAVAAEEIGFHSLWAPEHIVFFSSYQSSYPYKAGGGVPWVADHDPAAYDPLLVIAAAAGVTSTLRFGTTVLVVPERPALLTAKEVMTLDHLTDGRFEFGAGLGWSAEEYAALGVDWEKRGKRFDEYLEAIKAVWTQDRASYHGEFINFDDVILKPFPLTPGGPPILIGGNSAAAIRRAIRIGDGWYGVWMGFKNLEPKIQEIHEALKDAGRSLDDAFRLKLNFPIGPDVPIDEVTWKVSEARRLGIQEFVLELPIRSRHFEKDMCSWAERLGVEK